MTSKKIIRKRNELLSKYDLLQNIAEKVFLEMDQYSEDMLNSKINADQWSSLQVMYHVKIAEMLSRKYCEKKLSFQPKLPKNNLNSRFKRLVLYTYLTLPIKFKAPKGVGDSVLPDYIAYEVFKKDWFENRESLKRFIEELPVEYLDKQVYKHPFGFRLPISGMLDFFKWHLLRHGRQIRRNLIHLKDQST